MLDYRTLQILNAINGLAPDGKYVVIAVTDIIGALKADDADEDSVRSGLNALSERGYAVIKYEDETNVCLCVTPKGRLLFETRIEREIEKHALKRGYFLYAFLGALTGGAVTAAIAVTVALLV